MSDGETTRLPDGSAFYTMSGPLPENHWIYGDPACEDEHGLEEPPMPMKMGTGHPDRKVWEARLRAAGRYAVRAATMKGTDDDFDPDALIQSLIVGFLGYHTLDGESHT